MTPLTGCGTLKRSDLSRLAIYKEFAYLLTVGLTAAEIKQVKDETGAQVGTYHMYVDGPPAGMPGKCAVWVTPPAGSLIKAGDPFVAFAGPHYNVFTPAAVEFCTQDLLRKSAGADFVFLDNLNPLRTSWRPGVDGDGDGDVDGMVNTWMMYSRSALALVQSFSKALAPEVEIVPNTGGRIREFEDFCAAVSGNCNEDYEEVDKATGKKVYSIRFTAIDFGGCSRGGAAMASQRKSFAFLRSHETWEQALAMQLGNVVRFKARYLHLEDAGVV